MPKGKPKLKKLYFVSCCDEDVSEAEGVFDENENCLDVWSMNDAMWRNEYLSGFMEKLGFECIDRGPVVNKLEKKLVAHCKKEWGL